MKIECLWESSEFLAVIKPPGVPVQPDKTGDIDMVSLLAAEKKQLYVVHRLDRPVGGVLVFAKTKKAAAFFTEQSQKGELQKIYLAVVSGIPAEKQAKLTDWLLKKGRLNYSQVVREGTAGAKKAELRYRLLEKKEMKKTALLEVELLTGRHHQIRVQMANAGMPLWGDTKYNPKFQHKRGSFSIGLWAYKLGFYEQEGGKRRFMTASPSEEPFTVFQEIEGSV